MSREAHVPEDASVEDKAARIIAKNVYRGGIDLDAVGQGMTSLLNALRSLTPG